MSHSYSTTAEADYRRCQRLWWWRHREGWRPIVPHDALVFGTAWHEFRETGRVPQLPDPYQSAHLSALAISHPAPDCEIIEREIPFEVQLIPGTPLRGRIDALIATDEGLMLAEYKTTSSPVTPDSDYWTRLQMDAQISTYLLGARALGYDVRGVLYDVVRKTDLRPLKATPEASRKFKKDGTLYASQRLEDETPDDYGRRVLADIHARPEHYFGSKLLARTERELADHWLRMQTYARQMQHALIVEDAPQNPDGCHRYGRCDFLSCCLSGMTPDDFPQDLWRPDDDKTPAPNSIPW